MYHISLMSAAGQQLAESMGIPDAAVGAVLGYCVVFLGLVLLMCVVAIMGKAMAASRKKAAGSGSAAPAAASPAGNDGGAQAAAQPAAGSAGEVKLYDVPDKEAAMIMAIVADKMGKPLNELRFKSIKEVK